MKLAELKSAVYQLTQVSTTKQLKAQYEELKPLDMRYKVSWKQALERLRLGHQKTNTTPPFSKTEIEKKKRKESDNKKTKTKSKKSKAREPKANSSTNNKSARKKATDVTSPASFKEWLRNPPNEFSELFSAADVALASFDEQLAQGKRLTKQAITMTSSLDEFAEATVDEAKRLANAAQHALDTSREADLN